MLLIKGSGSLHMIVIGYQLYKSSVSQGPNSALPCLHDLVAQPLDVPRANWTTVDPLAEWKEPQINIEVMSNRVEKNLNMHIVDKGFCLEDNKIE